VEIRKVYEYALEREREGKRFYIENADRFGHAAAVQVFKELAAVEQKHIEYIQAHLDALEGREDTGGAVDMDLDRPGMFVERAESELMDQTVLEAMVPDLPVLRTAFLIERDFAEFYESAADQAEGEAHEVLENLAEWERSHEKLFRDIYDAAFEEYSKMPWAG
jgi:rubrerythrin